MCLLRLLHIRKEQKGILLMTSIFRVGGDLQINYVVGLALLFVSHIYFQPVSPTYTPVRRRGDGDEMFIHLPVPTPLPSKLHRLIAWQRQKTEDD